MGKHIPMRMCVVCRKMFPQKELVRFVRNADNNTAETDFDKKKFGRGAYVCRNPKCVEAAKKKHSFERHFKCAVPAVLYDKAEELIRTDNFNVDL